MTNEEMLEIAKGRLGYATAQSLCDTIGYWKAEKELFKGIVDALEKQIPKKVIVNKDGCRNCPNCYANESWICYEQDINEPFEYCANCGQKLDWENNNAI